MVRAILAGDAETGVSLMVMDEGLDTGPVLAARALAIREDEDAGSLTARLAELGGRLLVDNLGAYVDGELVAKSQDDSKATAAAKVTTAEARIDPHRHTSESIMRAVRAFNPRPGAWADVDGDRIKIWRAASSSLPADVGVARLEAGAVVLGTSDGAVELLEVQPPGKRAMTAAAWMHGRRGKPAAFTR